MGVTSLKSLAFNEIAKSFLSENNCTINSLNIDSVQDKKNTLSNDLEQTNFSLNGSKEWLLSDDNTVISLIDARNNQVYCGVFRKNYDDVYLATDVNEVLNNIKDYIEDNTIFVGNASVLHKELIQNYFAKTIQFSEHNEQSSISTAVAGLKIFKNGTFDTADSILPFYLRKSQAERMKDLSK